MAAELSRAVTAERVSDGIRVRSDVLDGGFRPFARRGFRGIVVVGGVDAGYGTFLPVILAPLYCTKIVLVHSVKRCGLDLRIQ